MHLAHLVADMNQVRIEEICPVCQSQLSQNLAKWLFHCNECGLWVSRIEQRDRNGIQNTPILENKREIGLKSLRIQNFQTLLDALECYMPLEQKTICDVGCAYGWFLEAAANRGMKAWGIEPDEFVANQGIKQGLNIKIGYFPDCVSDLEKFDAIAFNDSLEHLSNIDRVLAACYEMLTPSGKLIVNLPNSQGFFFKLGYFLFLIGYKQPWHRLWQKDYPFPHLVYFNPSNLEKYINRYGFKLVRSQNLKTITVSGLWQRLRMDRNSSIFVSAIIYCLILISYPFLLLFPSDTLLQIYQKN